MSKTIELVRQEVETIKNEVEDFANSASRIGEAMSDILEYNKELTETEANRAKDVEQSLSEEIDNIKEAISNIGGEGGEGSKEVTRAEFELVKIQSEGTFNAFSGLGMTEKADADGYEIALVKATNTAEKTKVKVPVFDVQNMAKNPVGLVDEIFVEDMASMMDDKIEDALKYFTPEEGGESIEVIDNLDSTSTTDALSANQGKVLNDKISNLTNNSVVYASKIGMIPNDSTEDVAVSNAEKIADIQNLGKRLIIDGVYYIKGNATWLDHCDIEGVDKETSKLIVTSLPTSSTPAFQLNAGTLTYIRMKNLSISVDGEKGRDKFNTLLSLLMQAKDLRYIEFDNIDDDGMRLLIINAGDVDMTDWDIVARVANIRATNIDKLYQTNNVPYKEFLCENCTIIDCYSGALHLAETNEFVNKSSKYFKRAIFRGNYMENSFIAEYEVTYLCMAIVEAQECHYYGNVVKNIASSNINSVVYDSYLSCRELYYYDNVVENVTSLNTQYRDIYKCKMVSSTEGRSLRYIRGNTYRLTKEVFTEEQLTQANRKFGNSLGTSGEIFDDFVFESNTVITDYGILSLGNFIKGKNVIVKGNHIEGRIANSFGTALVFLPETVLTEEGIPAYTPKLTIEGNTIISNNESGDTICCLIRDVHTVTEDVACDIIYRDNNLKNITPLLYESSAEKISIAAFNAFLKRIVSNDNVLYLDYKASIYYIGDNSKIISDGIEPNIYMHGAKNVEVVNYAVFYALSNSMLNMGDVKNIALTFSKDKKAFIAISETAKTLYTNYAKFDIDVITSYTEIYRDYSNGESIKLRGSTWLMQNTVISVDIDASINYKYHVFPVVCSTAYRNAIGQYSNIAEANTNKIPMCIDTDLGVPVFFVNGKWVNVDGYAAGPRSGARRVELTASLTGLDAGLQFYDTLLGKLVIWNGDWWEDLDGNEVTDSGNE